EGSSILKNATTGSLSSSSSSSPWLRKHRDHHRPTGCWGRPWICREGYYPPPIKRRCCKNQCVDVGSDVNNCGLCAFRCPFGYQCCGGQCVNTNRNPFNCGRCFNRCPKKVKCFYGMCGYAE
ncbi:Stig1 domain-containing protein, partial [Cephalotus follicularis]